MEEYRVCNERYRIRLGYLPTRRNSGLSKAEAGRQKREIEEFLRTNYADRITLVTIDELNEEGIILDPTDATRAADIFQRAHVDAIFAPHCNFGTEDAVAKTGKLVGKPLLLWGPRDEAPDERGFRLRDTQCGLFATSKALLRYGVPFTYITNSELKSETFRRGLEDFLAVACVVKWDKSASVRRRLLPSCATKANCWRSSELKLSLRRLQRSCVTFTQPLKQRRKSTAKR